MNTRTNYFEDVLEFIAVTKCLIRSELIVLLLVLQKVLVLFLQTNYFRIISGSFVFVMLSNLIPYILLFFL